MLSFCQQDASLADASKRPQWWWLLILALVAIGVYANSVRNEFAFDDVGIVQDNDHVRNLDWVQIWSDNYWPLHNGVFPDVLYRPLTIWSYLANQALTPGASWAFHLTNVLLNALLVVMVALLAWRIFARRSVAILSALFFALHPIHVEVVANTVGRAEILAAIWSVAALLVFLPTTPLLLQTAPVRRSLWHGWLVAACFFAAMLCKETPVTLAPAFVLIDIWRWSSWPRDSRPSLFRWMARQAFRYYFPIAAAFGLYILMRIHATGLMRNVWMIHPIVNPLVTATIPQRIVTPFALLAKYLAITFWPATLSADYSAPSFMPTANPFQPMALVGILLVLLTIIVTIRYWTRARPVILCLWLFALSYALVANVLRIGTIMGERLFYLPSVFVLMIVAWAIVMTWQSGLIHRIRYSRAPIAALIIAACVAMSVRTVIRNADWHDNITLALATAHDNPQSAKACYWAGFMLAQDAPQKWMTDFGVVLLKRAVELYETYPESHWELAKYYGRQNDLPKSTIYLAQAARYNPGTDNIRLAIKSVNDDLKKWSEEKLFPDFKTYLHDHPNAPEAHFAFGLALRAHGKFHEAQEQFNEALRLDGAFDEAVSELAMLHLDLGEPEAAVNTMRMYVRRINKNFDARVVMVHALFQLDPKKHPDALAEAQMNVNRAVEINPGSVEARALKDELKQKIKAAAEQAKLPTASLSSPPAGASVALRGAR